MLKIKVILASTRENRFGQVVANWVMGRLPQKMGVDFELLDIKEFDLPVYNLEITPGALKGNFPDKRVKAWADKITGADGFLIITPEYNHGYAAPLKNALDWLYPEWNNKAVGFVSYGSAAGGSRAVEQLRLVAVELQMAPIREGVHISNFWNAFNQEGDPADPGYNEKLEATVHQLVWWAEALKQKRETN